MDSIFIKTCYISLAKLKAYLENRYKRSTKILNFVEIFLRIIFSSYFLHPKSMSNSRKVGLQRIQSEVIKRQNKKQNLLSQTKKALVAHSLTLDSFSVIKTTVDEKRVFARSRKYIFIFFRQRFLIRLSFVPSREKKPCHFFVSFFFACLKEHEIFAAFNSRDTNCV